MSVRAPWYYVALIPEGGEGELVDLTDRVLSFEYEDHERKTDKLKLTVNNFDLRNFDDPVFRHGARLQVTWGNGVDTAPLREVVVRKVTGGRELTIEADDRAVEMDVARKTRTFENVRRSDVVRTLAVENGHQDPDVEETPEVFPVISQHNLSDAQMIRKMADLEGFEFFVDFDGLHWHRRRVGQAPIRTLTYYAANPAAAGDILDFSVENDITRKPGRVRVKSRDPMKKTDVEAVADNETDTDRGVLQEYIAFIDGETGNVTKQERVSYEEVRPSNVQTQPDAEREAKGRYRTAQQTAVKMKIDLRGAPSLIAKSVVTIDGLGKRLSGKYYAKVVTHKLDGAGGYTCSAELITDGYQRGYGAGKKGSSSGSEDAALSACADEVRAAIGALGSTAADGQLAVSLAALANEVVQIAGKSEVARVLSAQLASERAVRLSQAAARVARPEAAAAARRCAGVLRRMTLTEEARAEGDVNDLEGSGPGALTPVTKIDPETGDEFTEYVSKRGRDG